MAITPLPTPPSRDDPANFAARGDAFLGALPDFATELNDALPTINDAIPASEIAVALVNYKGDYNSATTYLVGQSVTYNGDRYLSKKTNLNITPVDGADWYALQASTEVMFRSILNQSSAITLLAADSGYLNVSGTTNININLPSATTLTGRTFVIKNVGSYAMFVFDFAGNYLFTLSANSASAIWASDITTNAGEWTIQDLPYAYESDKLIFGSTSTPSAFSFQAVGKLSTTKQIVVFNQTLDSTNKIYACIVTNTSGVLTFGLPQLISTDDGAQVATVGLSATSAIVSWRINSGTTLGKWNACAVSISGDTITAGTAINVSSGIIGFIRFSFLTATTAIGAAYTSTTSLYGSIFTVSGTTLTASTPVNLVDTDVLNSTYIYGLGSFSATTAMIIYGRGGNYAHLARSLSISGTTITVNTSVSTLVPTSNGNVSLAISGSTAATCVYHDSANTSLKIRGITLTGTTLSFGSEQQIASISLSSNITAVAHQTASTGYVVYHNSNGTGTERLIGFTKSGTVFTLGTEVTPNTTLYSATSYQKSLTDFSAPAVGVPSASYTLFCNPYIGVNVQLLTLSGTTASAATPKYVAKRLLGVNFEDTEQIASISATRSIILTKEYTDNLNVKITANLISYASATPTLVSSATVYAQSHGTTSISITALSATQVIVAYEQVSSFDLKASIVTISGDTLTVGSDVLVNGGPTNDYASLTRLSDTSALIHYVGDGSNGNKVNVLTVSGSAITVGTQYSIEGGSVSYCSCVALSSTQVVLSYLRSDIRIVLLTLSGATVTNISTSVLGLPGNYGYTNLVALSASKFIVSCGDSTRAYGRVIDVSNGTFALNTIIEINDEGYPLLFTPLTATQGFAFASGLRQLWNYKIINNTIILDKQIFTNTWAMNALQLNSVTPSANSGATLNVDSVIISTTKMLGFGAIK